MLQAALFLQWHYRFGRITAIARMQSGRSGAGGQRRVCFAYDYLPAGTTLKQGRSYRLTLLEAYDETLASFAALTRFTDECAFSCDDNWIAKLDPEGTAPPVRPRDPIRELTARHR